MPAVLGWTAVLVAVLFLLGWYLSYSAARLDRLHAKVESSRASLDAQLVRRAAAALDAAQLLDPSTGLLVADAAAEAMASGERAGLVPHPSAAGTFRGPDRSPDGGPDSDAGTTASREEAENELSRALHVAFAEPPIGPDADDPEPAGDRLPAARLPVAHLGGAHLAGAKLSADVLAGLTEAAERVQLARRFHNDAVAQAQRVRRKRVVRWARLAGRAAMPPMFEIDDSLPPGLVRQR